MTKIPIAVRNLLKQQKKHKYGAKKCQCLHKHDHDSQKEAMWCVKLHQEQREGKIRNLLMQTTYDLHVNGVLVCKHILDFDYDRCTIVPGVRWDEVTHTKAWVPEVVDVKGMKLPVWSIKHKLFCALYTGVKYIVV